MGGGNYPAMDSLDNFAPFSLFALLTGTFIYAFREFYIVLLNVYKYEDGRTGYMNYGFWNKGPSTENPHASLVEAVIDQLDVRVLNENARDGQVFLLEIGSGLGQSAIDAVCSLGRFSQNVLPRSLLIRLASGSNVSVTGVSINEGHVAAANKLATSTGLSSRITHRLLNATEVNTLQSAPFSGAYSCEVIAEIPDDVLRACFAALHDALPPGAEFSYADIVSTENSPTTRAKSSQLSDPSQELFARLVRLIAPRIVTMMFGDNWRPVSRFNSLLAEAGFEVMSTKSIGDRVFVPTWDYARERMQKRPNLGVEGLFTQRTIRFITWACLYGLAAVWEDGKIDYVLVKARRI